MTSVVFYANDKRDCVNFLLLTCVEDSRDDILNVIIVIVYRIFHRLHVIFDT